MNDTKYCTKNLCQITKSNILNFFANLEKNRADISASTVELQFLNQITSSDIAVISIFATAFFMPICNGKSNTDKCDEK